MKILLTEDDLRGGVERLASQVSAAHGEGPLTVLAVLTGSLVLLADLIRRLRQPLRLGVLQARSYGQGTTRGELTLNFDWLPEIAGHDVLLLDDILDTGHTLSEVARLLRQRRPRSLRTAVLLRKRGRQEVAFEPDFVAFEIPDEFVVGYGLDYRDAFRNLPYLAALEPHDLRELA